MKNSIFLGCLIFGLAGCVLTRRFNECENRDCGECNRGDNITIEFYPVMRNTHIKILDDTTVLLDTILTHRDYTVDWYRHYEKVSKRKAPPFEFEVGSARDGLKLLINKHEVDLTDFRYCYYKVYRRKTHFLIKKYFKGPLWK